MSYEAIVDFVYGLLTQVEGIGKVYKYERWVIREKDFVDTYSITKNVGGKDVKVINGWEITRASYSEKILDTGNNEATHTILIRGFYSVDDSNASAHEFQKLVDKIIDKLMSGFEPPSGEFYLREAPRVMFTTIMFGSYLVHTCEITLSVNEIFERRVPE